jgi:hypothetical protein
MWGETSVFCLGTPKVIMNYHSKTQNDCSVRGNWQNSCETFAGWIPWRIFIEVGSAKVKGYEGPGDICLIRGLA